MMATKRAMAWKRAMARVAKAMTMATKVVGDEEGQGGNGKNRELVLPASPNLIPKKWLTQIEVVVNEVQLKS